jgi:hypothetical protein
VTSTTAPSTWPRAAWWAGIVFVVVLVAETAISAVIPIDQNSSAAKIAHELDAHSTLVLVVAGLCVVYAAAFPIYLWKLYDLVRVGEGRMRTLAVLVLVGGALFIVLHAVSDVGIYGMLGSKLASYSAQHDVGISYTLYLTTFAIDSVGDVFGSLFLLAAGILVLRDARLPRWLAYVAIGAAACLFVQAFGLGGVIATFGLVLDLIGFLLLLLFVLVSSAVMLRRDTSSLSSSEHAPIA